MNYNNINSIIDGFIRVLSLKSVGSPPPIPTPLIFFGVPRRQGLSATRVASRIIARKSEAGLPVGALPSGQVSPDEIMYRIMIEEIYRDLQQNALISVAIPPGITLTAAGLSPAGPVSVFGSTITFNKGYGTIQ